MRHRRAFSYAIVLMALGGAVAGGDSIIGVGSTTQPAEAPQTQDAGHRVIGIPLSATGQNTGNAVGPLQSPAFSVAPSSGLTKEEAVAAVHALALAHPNPDVRAAAYSDHADDWNVNVELQTFSLVLRDPTPRFVAGTLSKHDGVTWRAEFNDNESLANPWKPPATASLTLEQARALLDQMCSARAPTDPAFRRAGEALKTARPDAASAGAETILKSPESPVVWKINAEARTFSFTEATADAAELYTGEFGWDANKSWTAWPVMHTHVSATDVEHPQVTLALPADAKAQPASAPGSTHN